jgi:trehalose/maltose hydrolase-like predicted phosphorylase
VTIQAVGTGIQATVASQLDVSSNISATPAQTDQATDQSVGQRIGFSVADGQTYTITKYVGVESSQDTPSDTVTAARGQASSAAATGWDALLLANKAAWASLWRGWIEIRGNRTLATDVNASEFYLWSSTRAGVDWSVSPAGLSSNGYDGHIFWDAETWMYPSLLAQHPDLAAGMNNYRFARLSAAEQHASATGYAGARFPWESALDGTEQIPPPVSVNSEGLYEQHITADIALAQWQYYLATGDKNWLSARGWPVLSQAATFWASRARVGSDGKYHIDGVTGPDEENPNVNDEAYTNVGAMRTLQDAVQAARVLGVTAPANWSTIAAGLVVPVRGGIHPEFSGYGGQLVKQADVTLLQYPWGYQTSRQVSLNDINFYVPRTDPGGPSMSDAVNLIDNSALNTPGCASYVYVERSYQPFIKDTFHQFSETRTGGAFTFMTGIGGFLQEFLYGYSGMRWNPGSVGLDPSLSSQIGGIVLHDLQWRGRTFQVAIGPQRTSVMLTSGSPLPVMTPQGVRLVRRGRRHGLTMATRRPDLTRTRDAVRCGRIRASSSAAGAPALAAVDGSPATDWQPAKVHATLTAALAPLSGPVRTITLRWGRMWPPAPAPNVPPPPGPVTVLRPSRYVVQVSRNGRTWRTVARVGRRSGVLDTVHLQGGAKERFVRIRVTAASVKKLPELDELTATG